MALTLVATGCELARATADFEPGGAWLAAIAVSASLLATVVMGWRAVRRHTPAPHRGERMRGPRGLNELRAEPRCIIPVLVVACVGGSATWLAASSAHRAAKHEGRLRFEKIRDRVASEVQTRVFSARFPLQGALGAWGAAGELRRDDLRRYVTARKFEDDFPGVLGIGFVKPVTTDGLPAFVAAERADGAPDFQIHPVPTPDGVTPRAMTSPERRFVITSCFPEAPNRKAWGLEIGGEAVRREAIERAITTGAAAISGKIKLVQAEMASSGFLLFVPVFSRDVTHATSVERQQALIGLIYSPILLEPALASIPGLITEGLDFEIFDGDAGRSSMRLYDADHHLGDTDHGFDLAKYRGRLFVDMSRLSVGNRDWTLVTSSLPTFEASIREDAAWLWGVGGSLMSILATGLTWLLVSGRSRALRLARRITEDLRAAQQSADRLASIARLTSNGVLVMDREGRIEWVNEGFTRITGYEMHDVVGRDPVDFLYGPESDESALKSLLEARNNGEPCKIDLVNRRRNGEPYRASTEMMPLLSAEGILTGFMEVETDVTDRVEALEGLRVAKAQAEAALRETAAFRATLDEHSIISVADRAGRIIDVNDRFCEISGYSKAQLLGGDHRILNSGHHPREFWVHMWQTLGRGAAWRGEVCNRRQDGTLYWVDSIIAGFSGPDGKVERFVSIRSDISARKKAEAEMAESESRFRNLADSAPMFVWTGGTSVERGYVNRAWLDFTGQVPRDGGQLDWEEAVHAEDRARYRDTLQKAVVERGKFEVEYRLRRSDGVYRAILDRAAPRLDSEGRITGFVGAALDVTELREARAKAEAASLAKSAFLANMSHEIRTPLTAILGFTELLRDDLSTSSTLESRLHAIDTIRRAGAHLMTVISDILDLSKIEAEQMTVEKVETRPLDLFEEVASMMRGPATGKGIVFEAKVTSDVPEQIWGDPTRIRQILVNLVGNAVKFTEQGHVRLSMRVEDKAVLIVDVDDTGPGLTPDQASGLFQAFVQADETVSRKFGGTGLGLTICRRLANLMQGSVVLASTEPGRGSCFRLTIPLHPIPGTHWIAQTRNRVDVSPSRHGASVHRLSGRVLLAEDGPDNQRLISFHLRKAGALVDIADNGAIAQQMLATALAEGRPYQLLVTDMQMPVVDGYELARSIRKAGGRMAIVALTANAMREDRVRCLEAGCDDYASKPLDKAAFLQTCAAWMGQPSTHPIGNAKVEYGVAMAREFI